MSDDGSASPAAVLRSIVARAVDCDPAGLGDRTAIVERASGSANGADEPEGSPTSVGRLAELIGGSDSVVAVVPRFDADLAGRLNASLSAGDEAHESGAADDATAPSEGRVVFTGSAADRLTGTTGAVVRRALADRGVDAYRHEGESPIAVVLADDRAAVGLIDGAGVAALLWTRDAAVREWAAATCRRYLDAAEPVADG
ncbi:transcriptional regulator FilR1 domain-containing protein [Halorubrum ezzemoulense]|uniref:transcriptional regulator FilR1 domain-containing protein n=1 Tax=Halorubrum ezzemoulense TaxID=337243 RepID=UPI00232CD90F|nr:hypothetical protein [Halorubrum ezzemoulense]MDB2240875.1 hypothetical protein [Halorubrum ezzemoulense]